MASIPVDKLISLFQQMYKEHWTYIWGAARRGCVDCSGAFVWAYEQFGRSIPHGSNAIARNHVRALLPVSKAEPGMAAFKYREPGQANYSLPDKYKGSGDLRDYYHIGLVDTDGKHVLNAQGTQAGFTRTALSKWGCVGYLNAVDYDKGGGKPMQDYTVTAPDGNPVKLREQPKKDPNNVICKINCGTLVHAEPPVNGWQEVHYGDTAGYMMTQFLKPVTSGDSAGGVFIKSLTMDEYNRLCEARDILVSIVGVG